MAQLIKHRKSYAPQECAHCGRIWYGPYCEHKDHHLVPEGLILCVFCWAALDDYILREHMEYHHAFREVTEEEQRAVTSACLSWVHDPTKKPLPKKEAKRFDPSVPKWMRSAVKQGMVKPNSNIAYRIESRDQVAISASIVSESKSAEDSA